MAQLAIKGHQTRGKEVIEILKSLGGINTLNFAGLDKDSFYYIGKSGIICHCCIPHNRMAFTLEEFLAKFPYKVGDKVIYEDKRREITKMVWDGITNTVAYKLDDKLYCNVINELHPYKEEEIMETITIDDFKANTKEWLIDKLHDMVISKAIKTIGDIHEELHKPQYPKTYEECCKVLGYEPDEDEINCYHGQLIEPFVKILICRDAYWKIAGNWKPNLGETFIYAIGACYGVVEKRMVTGSSGILLFQTEEMCDAFYENFKDLIEQCKELL